jgi:hypothetical protein
MTAVDQLSNSARDRPQPQLFFAGDGFQDFGGSNVFGPKVHGYATIPDDLQIDALPDIIPNPGPGVSSSSKP